MSTRDDPTPVDDLEQRVAFEAIRGRLFDTDAQPVAIGRFLVTSRVGQGGMGVVYAAYDPQLDRRVAVKVVRGLGRDADEIGRARRSLEREARAAAGLTHPNVVTIYDSGSTGDGFYVAMEFVPGSTLRQWLRQRERAWVEILRMFVAAGRGLQAAHAASLVHCDFKPDNVLVGADERPRVADFGLVKHAGGHTDATSDDEAQALTARSTATGTSIGGTPRYMAPEQHDGAGIGPPSDQFAFCVALYEALFRAHPYPRRGDPEQADVREGELGRAHERSRVPRAIVRDVLQGLRRDPAARHPSMQVLLDRLERTLRRRSLARAGALGVVAAALTGGAGYVLAEAPVDPCAQAAVAMDASWSAAEQAATRQALEAAAPLGAAEDLVARLDAYARAWGDMRHESCAATHHRGEQSAELLELRTACLDRRQRVFEQAVARLRGLAPHQGFEAQRIVEWLPPLAGCGADEVRTERAIRGMTQGTTDRSRSVETEAAFTEVLAQLGDARLELVLGRQLEALALAEAAEQRAHAMGLRYLEAEATVLRAGIQAERGHHEGLEAALSRALALATEADDADTAATAIVQLLRLERHGGPAVENRPLLLMLGRAWAERTRRAVTLHAELAREQAAHHGAKGETAAALELLDQALAMPLDEASAWAVRSEKSQVLMKAGRLREAEPELAAVLAQQRAALPPGHAVLADTVFMLSEVLRLEGRVDEALPLVREALAIYRERFGEHHPNLVSAQRTLAELLQQQGQWDEALQAFERLIADHERIHGAGHPKRAIYLNQLAELEHDAGHFPRGRDHAAQALSLATAAFGAEHPVTFAFGITLGKLELALGRHDVARPLLTTALERLRGAGADPAWAAEAAHHLARLAMLSDPPDRTRALAWSNEALEGLRGAQGAAAARLSEAIVQWRAASGLVPP